MWAIVDGVDSIFRIVFNGKDMRRSFGLLSGERLDGCKFDRIVKVQLVERLQIDHPFQFRRKSCPEEIEQVEFSNGFVSDVVVSVDLSGVQKTVGLDDWLRRQESILAFTLHDEIVRLVKTAKIIPDIFRFFSWPYGRGHPG